MAVGREVEVEAHVQAAVVGGPDVTEVPVLAGLAWVVVPAAAGPSPVRSPLLRTRSTLEDREVVAAARASAALHGGEAVAVGAVLDRPVSGVLRCQHEEVGAPGEDLRGAAWRAAPDERLVESELVYCGAAGTCGHESRVGDREGRAGAV